VAKRPQPGTTRFLVYERDGNRCLNCGATEPLTLDHVRPQCRGGTGDPDNLQTLCVSCNHFKGDKYPLAIPFAVPTYPAAQVDMEEPVRDPSQYHSVDWRRRRPAKWWLMR
jgi:5-methylcytosine-specific restriction endonuclease McrA